MTGSTKSRSEHVEQREFVMWFRQTYKPIRIYSIPNGGGRTAPEALRLKVEGVSAGVPDLHVPEWSLWIEMKKEKGGRLSKEQEDWKQYLTSIGHKWIRANGCADAVEQVMEIAAERTGK